MSDERGPQGRQRCASTSQIRGSPVVPVGLPESGRSSGASTFWYVRAFRPSVRSRSLVRAAGIAINLGIGQSADSTDEGTSEDGGRRDGRGERGTASPKEVIGLTLLRALSS